MPTDGAWPPEQHAAAYSAYRDWDAWYVGNPDTLRAVYSGRGALGQNVPPSQRTRPGQYSGGLVGRFSRWLWGTPPPPNSRDTRLHVPLPADLTAVAANLLFSEPPKLTAGDTAVQQRLDELVEDGLGRTLLHAAEAASALGDVYLRPVIDQDVLPGRAFIAVAHADGALPVIRWGRLVEVTFWSEIANDGQKIVRLLEHHDVDRTDPDKPVGRITYALHEGSRDRLGQRIDLGAFDDTKPLKELVAEQGFQPTGLDRLDVVWVPNSGPQRMWRNLAGLKYLGRSDFDGNEPVFDSIDEVWTSWMRDIRLAKGRITVPDIMLQSQGPGQGATWDPDREVYSAINALPQQLSGGGITISQFAIRYAEHKASIDALVEVALRHAGFSSQTLGEEGDVPVTATEIQARERMTFTTRGNRIQTWRPAIADLAELLLAVEAIQFAGPMPVRPEVDFGDSVSEAPETVARTLQLVEAAKAASIETKVRMLHPEWDDTKVAKEVEAIKGDTGMLVEDPGSFTGGPPAPPGAGDEDQGDEAEQEAEPAEV